MVSSKPSLEAHEFTGQVNGRPSATIGTNSPMMGSTNNIAGYSHPVVLAALISPARLNLLDEHR